MEGALVADASAPATIADLETCLSELHRIGPNYRKPKGVRFSYGTAGFRDK